MQLINTSLPSFCNINLLSAVLAVDFSVEIRSSLVSVVYSYVLSPVHLLPVVTVVLELVYQLLSPPE